MPARGIRLLFLVAYYSYWLMKSIFQNNSGNGGRMSFVRAFSTTTNRRFSGFQQRVHRGRTSSSSSVSSSSSSSWPSTTRPRTRTPTTMYPHLQSVYSSSELSCSTSPQSSSSSSSLAVLAERHVETLFDLELPEGRCVGLQLRPDLAADEQLTVESLLLHHKESSNSKSNNNDHWIRALLHPDEVAYSLEKPSDAVRNTFLLGRLALRHALGSIAVVGDSSDDGTTTNRDFAILKDMYGRPTLPPGLLGSISHKKSIGAALVAMADSEDKNNADSARLPRRGIGVDIEQITTLADRGGKKKSVARRVLTEREQNELGRIPNIDAEEEVLLRFSIKESLYKAMHPLICQYVGFQEAEVTPRPDGSVEIELNLKSGDHHKFATVQAHWRKIENSGNGDNENYYLFLSSAVVTLNDSVQAADECSTDAVYVGRNS